MVSSAVRTLFFGLALSGLMACWIVLVAWGRAIRSVWGPLIYLIGLTLCEGVFCLGMAWNMDPYAMPRVFCVMQPIVIAFSTFLMTGLVTAFSCSTYLFITRGGKSPLQWHPLYLLPLVAFPIAATTAQATIVIKFDAIQPSDGIQCDANDPLWTRFLSYAGAPFVMTIPSIAFSVASVIRIRATDRSARTSRLLVAPDAGFPSPVHSVCLPSPVLPAFARYSAEPGFYAASVRGPPSIASARFALPSSNHGENNYPKSSPLPSTPSSNYAQSLPSPVSVTGLITTPYHTGRRPGVSFSEPTSVWPAVLAAEKQIHLVRSEETHLARRSPFEEEDMRLDEEEDEEGSLPSSGAAEQEEVEGDEQEDEEEEQDYDYGEGVDEEGRGTQSAESELERQSAESERVCPVMGSALSVPSKDGELDMKDGDLEESVSTPMSQRPPRKREDGLEREGGLERKGGTERRGGLKRKRKPRRLSLASSVQSRRSASASHFRAAIWRIVFFQITFIAVQILSSVTTVINIATSRATPSPVGTHHAALLLAGWGPVLVFGFSPAVRREMFFWRVR